MKRIKEVLRRIIEAVRFRNSSAYWSRRYAVGGNSGEGSYGELAAFKAEIINAFVKTHNVTSVIEFGCGDGNQLKLMQYPAYFGVDVSPVAISTCRKIFDGDSTKRFVLLPNYAGEKAALALSLDVIFHLVEDAVFEEYMQRLFAASFRHVIIYSSNCEEATMSPHVRHRVFTEWVARHQPDWKLVEVIANRYPIGLRPTQTSFGIFLSLKRETTPDALFKHCLSDLQPVSSAE